MKEEHLEFLIRSLVLSGFLGAYYLLGESNMKREMEAKYEPIIKGLEMASSREVHESDKRLYEQLQNWYDAHKDYLASKK
ncbi:MAG: hypothetical protein NUV46_03115 [Nanoarchaeota archaeon]|nr:hypothetical protein [Nanoarchaeota archaeon]